MGPLGEYAHFIGNYGKASPLFSGASGLNGGIECQEVGLLGNSLNGRENGVDLLGIFSSS